MGRGAWQVTVHGVTRVRDDLATKPSSLSCQEHMMSGCPASVMPRVISSVILLHPFKKAQSAFPLIVLGFPGGSDGKESTCNAGEAGSISRLGRFPWRRERLTTPVFWPGEFHGQRSLEGYSQWGHKELDMTA